MEVVLKEGNNHVTLNYNLENVGKLVLAYAPDYIFSNYTDSLEKLGGNFIDYAVNHSHKNSNYNYNMLSLFFYSQASLTLEFIMQYKIDIPFVPFDTYAERVILGNARVGLSSWLKGVFTAKAIEPIFGKSRLAFYKINEDASREYFSDFISSARLRQDIPLNILLSTAQTSTLKDKYSVDTLADFATWFDNLSSASYCGQDGRTVDSVLTTLKKYDKVFEYLV